MSVSLFICTLFMMRLSFLVTLILLISYSKCQQYPNEAQAKILRQINVINPDGSYRYAYETENNIAAEEQGFLRNRDTPTETQVKIGQYQYISPEGEVIHLAYSADDTGFHPSGSHLPVAPPVPPLIQKALQYLAMVGKL